MRPNPRSFSIPWITRKLWLPLRSKSHNRRCEIYWGSHAPIDPIHRLESMNWMNSDERSDLYRITSNRPMHRMRPEPRSLSTDHQQLGTELSLLDLLHLRAMRLYADAKRTCIVKSKTIESGGVRGWLPCPSIATWACSGDLQNVVWAWAEGQGGEEWTNEELTGLMTVMACKTYAVDAKAKQRIWFVYVINSDGLRMSLLGA